MTINYTNPIVFNDLKKKTGEINTKPIKDLTNPTKSTVIIVEEYIKKKEIKNISINHDFTNKKQQKKKDKKIEIIQKIDKLSYLDFKKKNESLSSTNIKNNKNINKNYNLKPVNTNTNPTVGYDKLKKENIERKLIYNKETNANNTRNSPNPSIKHEIGNVNLINKNYKVNVYYNNIQADNH